MGTINKITRHFGWADHRLTSAVNSVNNVPTCTRKLKRKRALFVKMGGQRWPYLKGQDNERGGAESLQAVPASNVEGSGDRSIRRRAGSCGVHVHQLQHNR